MAKNRFEQVDEPQPDAITLSLGQRDGKSFIRIACPAELAAGHLVNDFVSDELEPVEGFRSPIVVEDTEGLWQDEWGELYRED